MATSLNSLYSLPLPQPNLRQSNLKKSQKSQKRKRHGRLGGIEEGVQLYHSQQESIDAEYASVITPIERTQRRLAGQALNQQPPAFPFPHTPSPFSSYEQNSKHNAVVEAEAEKTPATSSTPSLKEQHVAAMTAVLHKYLDLRDYHRAARAFALLLRTEILGSSVDLRHCGLWGIGAEVLLHPDTGQKMDLVSRDALERVKTYYNRLALQHPWQRRWSSITDAQEFKSAMFALWIFTVCAESKRMQIIDSPDGSDLSFSLARTALEAKQWELDEAGNIAKELDSLMNTIPFVDNLEFLRLRAMVALWLADLLEMVEQLRIEFEIVDSAREYDVQSLTAAEDHAGEASNENLLQFNQSSKQADDARDFAATMFARLGYQDRGDSGDADDWND